MSSWVDKLIGVDRALVSQYGHWELRWQAMPKAWVIALIIVPIVLGLPGVVYRREAKSAGGGARTALSVIRSALIAILLLALFQPILYLERELTKESYILVLVDESKSMNLKDKYTEEAQYEALAKVTGLERDGHLTPEGRDQLAGMSRLDIVNAALRNPNLKILDQLKERYIFKAFSFSSGITPDPDLGNMKAEGTQTGIGDAIDTVLKKLQGQPIAAMVLITDGRSNSGTDPIATAANLVERGVSVPIYTVGVGNPLPAKDIALSKLEAPEVAVARDFVEFKFMVQASKGFENETIQVSMRARETPQDSAPGDWKADVCPAQDVKLVGNNVEQEVLMRWKPEKPGKYEIEISTPVRADELVEENNVLTHSIQIVDNKIRVLFVDGYPRWEYRYLKNALVRDQSMTVQVFLKSADEDFPQEGSPGVPPLTEFPGEKKQLAENYDVVILGDIDPNDLGTSKQTSQQVLENLAWFVEEGGGGLIMIAGEFYAPAAYADTPLARVLPVSVDRSSRGAIVHDDPVRAELTPIGKVHPLMRLSPALTPEENLELWQDADGKGDGLDGFYWFSRVRSPKAGATVLAQHPTFDVENGQKLPIFCFQRVGRGLCFFSGVDSTWRWRFIRGDQYFYTFWGQITRFVRAGRLIGSKRFLVELDKKEYTISDNVRITARVLDKEYEPLKEPEYPAEIAQDLSSTTEITLKGVPNPSSDPRKLGWYEGGFKVTRKGHYEVSVGPRGLDDGDPRTTVGFDVKDPDRENDNTTMDAMTLSSIAETTKGKFLTVYEIDRLLATIKETGEIVDIETKEQDLWDTPLVFLIFAVLITIEWVWRKLVRLI